MEVFLPLNKSRLVRITMLSLLEPDLRDWWHRETWRCEVSRRVFFVALGPEGVRIVEFAR